MFKVVDAPAPMFDAFMAQVYEDITDIDRQTWDIYDRWDIINDALAYGDMALLPAPDGTLVLEVAQPEEKPSGAEEKAPAPELQPAGAKGRE
jgi:hypothetical protein